MVSIPQTKPTPGRLRPWMMSPIWWTVVLLVAVAWFCLYGTAMWFSVRIPQIEPVMTLLVPNLFIAAWIALTGHRDAPRRFPVLSAAARGALLAIPLWLLFSLPVFWQAFTSSRLLTSLYYSPSLNLATVAISYALIGATVGSFVGIARDFIPRPRVLNPR